MKGAHGNNLKSIDVTFPLGVLCVVTGVSGSGKSTLVKETLFPALRQRLSGQPASTAPHDDIDGQRRRGPGRASRPVAAGAVGAVQPGDSFEGV